MTPVAGADVRKGQWVAVVLENRQFSRAITGRTIRDVVAEVGEVSVLAVDIPIGLPDVGHHRQCDMEAKAFVGASLTPSAQVIAESDYHRANELSKRLCGFGVFKQTHALRAKILEVEPVARGNPRIIEAHPEVSYRTMNDAPLEHSKKSWNGQVERRQLLESQGIHLPGRLGAAGAANPDDVLDAAAIAWTAWLASRGKASVLPESVSGCPLDRRQVVWH
jgi:predicted RNase H-like nuclease